MSTSVPPTPTGGADDPASEASATSGAVEGSGAPAPQALSDAEMLDQRYGRRSGRRPVLVAAVLAVAAAVAWLTWATLSGSTVTSELVAVEVVDPGRVDVTVSIITDPGTTVTCTVRAVNASFAEVGVREVTLGPVTERVTTTTVPVSTVEQAVSGEVQSCTATDP